MNGKLLLIPNVGIEFNWNKILLWSTNKQIINALWKPDKVYGKNTYYNIYNHQVLFYFDENKSLIYIEITYLNDNNVLYLEKINIFQEKVEKLVTLLSDKYWNYISNDKWYFYDFTKINLSLRRESIPKDFHEDLGENDYQKWIYFNTVWIWIDWYLEKI